jgi:hypothetical protein
MSELRQGKSKGPEAKGPETNGPEAICSVTMKKRNNRQNT